MAVGFRAILAIVIGGAFYFKIVNLASVQLCVDESKHKDVDGTITAILAQPAASSNSCILACLRHTQPSQCKSVIYVETISIKRGMCKMYSESARKSLVDVSSDLNEATYYELLDSCPGVATAKKAADAGNLKQRDGPVDPATGGAGTDSGGMGGTDSSGLSGTGAGGAGTDGAGSTGGTDSGVSSNVDPPPPPPGGSSGGGGGGGQYGTGGGSYMKPQTYQPQPQPKPYVAPQPQPQTYQPKPQPYVPPAPQPQPLTYQPKPQTYQPAPQPQTYQPKPQTYQPAPQTYQPAPQPQTYQPAPAPQTYQPKPQPYVPPAPQPQPQTYQPPPKQSYLQPAFQNFYKMRNGQN